MPQRSMLLRGCAAASQEALPAYLPWLQESSDHAAVVAASPDMCAASEPLEGRQLSRVSRVFRVYSILFSETRSLDGMAT